MCAHFFLLFTAVATHGGKACNYQIHHFMYWNPWLSNVNYSGHGLLATRPEINRQEENERDKRML
jgi:hypothetical protein